MASACSSLKQGLSSQPEIEVSHISESTQPSQLDQWSVIKPGPSAVQKRVPTKTETSETSKVFIRRKNDSMCIDRLTGELRERE